MSFQTIAALALFAAFVVLLIAVDRIARKSGVPAPFQSMDRIADAIEARQKARQIARIEAGQQHGDA